MPKEFVDMDQNQIIQGQSVVLSLIQLARVKRGSSQFCMKKPEGFWALNKVLVIQVKTSCVSFLFKHPLTDFGSHGKVTTQSSVRREDVAALQDIWCRSSCSFLHEKPQSVSDRRTAESQSCSN